MVIYEMKIYIFLPRGPIFLSESIDIFNGPKRVPKLVILIVLSFYSYLYEVVSLGEISLFPYHSV